MSNNTQTPFLDALIAERDTLRADVKALRDALQLALDALDGEVDGAPLAPRYARLAQLWMRDKFGREARAALTLTERSERHAP